jgi:hypothetical protein
MNIALNKNTKCVGGRQKIRTKREVVVLKKSTKSPRMLNPGVSLVNRNGNRVTLKRVK